MYPGETRWGSKVVSLMMGACKSGRERKVEVGDVVLSRRAAAEDMRRRITGMCKMAGEDRDREGAMTVSARSETSNKSAKAEKYNPKDARNWNRYSCTWPGSHLGAN
jgi:hypothetical protein